MRALLTYNQMVVYQLDDEALDQLFHALSDATRRDVLRRAVEGDLSVSRLADSYSMSFAAVQKHIAVLQRAGLVTKERRGREHIVSTDPESLGLARDAVARLEAVWRDRVGRMSDLLADDPGTTNDTVTKGRNR